MKPPIKINLCAVCGGQIVNHKCEKCGREVK